MSIALTIKLACKNILGNRMRSGLTVLGLVIGIASVIILVGIGNGAANSVQSQVASMGTDIITVSISDSDNALSYDQVSEMSRISAISEVSPYVNISATMSKNGDSSEQASLVGAGAAYSGMMNYELSAGRKISRIDVDNSSKVAIIGCDVAEEFWGSADAVGDTIKLDGDNYTVIGVLESVGSSMGNNVDESLIIPISTAKYLGANTSVTQLYARAESEEKVDDAVTSLEQYLMNCGISEDDFSVSSQEQMLEAMEDINNTLSKLLGGIAAISLLVGGIGVMNVMLVSVTERTKEIGIRKSLGAKRKDILYQFLIESMVLSIIGGIIGIIVGFIGGEIATLAGASFAPGLGMVLLSFIVSVAVGLIFGIFPSYRAACLRPVEALRYE